MGNIYFGEKMRRARIQNALSQAELADKIGVTQPTISNWEKLKSAPDKAQKVLIRAVLGFKAAETGGTQTDAEPSEGDESLAPSAFGTWLNRTRLDARLSVAELADRADVSAPAIYSIESGRIENPRSETVRRLEQALGRNLPDETKKEIRDEATVEGVGEFFEFDPHSREDWPEVPGIYVLYDISERPIYVGQGGSIKKRIADHEEKFWFKSPIVSTAAYIKIDDSGLRKKIETILIRFLKRNAVINKQNVER